MNDEQNKYSKQHRGTAADYENYFAGMDASMQQKIALTTAHFPARGRIADMGSGSGRGTFDLARLYKNLELVGVDINPVAVEQSRQKYQSENLRFAVGDIAERVFADESLDGILDSSVLHHVTSFNDYDAGQIHRTICNQVAQLKTGGVLIIRDFVVPAGGDQTIFLDLPVTDGKPAGETTELSTAALFEVFARDFRSSVNRSEAVPFVKLSSPRAGFVRFETKLRAAAEFVLRKDYRQDWDAELIEEYTYFSQTDFEAAFRRNNLRIVVSVPLWNPWIVENRFAGKFFISDKNGAAVGYPPTNFLIVGEKIPADAGYELIEAASAVAEEPKFLNLTASRHRRGGQVFELAERPHQTVDLLPWFEVDKQIFVLAKKDFPRPLLNACRAQPQLGGASYSGYLTEPISAISDFGFETADWRESICEILRERADLQSSQILEIGEPQFYFVSPGGIDERVASFPVKIEAWRGEAVRLENYTKFTSAGAVRELDARQVLRAAGVGGMFDARLEINIYRLLRRLKLAPSAWIGAQIKSPIQDLPAGCEISSAADLTPPKFAAFEPAQTPKNRFLELRRGNFAERDSRGALLAQAEFEYVAPKNYSKNTVAAIPFFQTSEETFVGIEFRDLPAPQRFTGSSRLACVPAWRLPFTVKGKFDLEPFVEKAYKRDFKVVINRSWELGGSYFTSPGVTPEVVYPLATEINAAALTKSSLRFFRLSDLTENIDCLQDAHLLILLSRLRHSLQK